ncbi:MAG: hypothetical protein ACRCY5_04895 [Phocaeicola sp.]
MVLVGSASKSGDNFSGSASSIIWIGDLNLFMSKTMRTFVFFLFTLCYLSASAGGFIRKIEHSTFVPKGQWIAGSTFSYSASSDNNYKFLVIEGINTEGYAFKVSPMIAYSFKDNLAAGGRFFYKRSLTDITSMNIKFNEDSSFDLNDVYSLNHSYGATALLRNYINIGTSRRFALYNEFQLSVERGQAKMVRGSLEKLTGTYETRTSIGLGLSPGLVAFINNFMAVEVGIGVLGFSIDKVRQVTDQIHMAESSLTVANFKINVFSISFGMAFYL